jgi:hypothetical protein
MSTLSKDADLVYSTMLRYGQALKEWHWNSIVNDVSRTYDVNIVTADPKHDHNLCWLSCHEAWIGATPKAKIEVLQLLVKLCQQSGPKYNFLVVRELFKDDRTLMMLNPEYPVLRQLGADVPSILMHALEQLQDFKMEPYPPLD